MYVNHYNSVDVSYVIYKDVYGGGVSVSAYSRLYSGMYDDDTCDDDRASSSLVSGAESLHCESLVIQSHHYTPL